MRWQNGPVMQRPFKSAWYGVLDIAASFSYYVFQDIIAFLLNQNRQFGDTIEALNNARKSLDPARFFNNPILEGITHTFP